MGIPVVILLLAILVSTAEMGFVNDYTLAKFNKKNQFESMKLRADFTPKLWPLQHVGYYHAYDIVKKFLDNPSLANIAEFHNSKVFLKAESESVCMELSTHWGEHYVPATFFTATTMVSLRDGTDISGQHEFDPRPQDIGAVRVLCQIGKLKFHILPVAIIDGYTYHVLKSLQGNVLDIIATDRAEPSLSRIRIIQNVFSIYKEGDPITRVLRGLDSDYLVHTSHFEGLGAVGKQGYVIFGQVYSLYYEGKI